MLGITKHEVVFVRPGAAHAPTRVKLDPQVYSIQQQISAKFHTDRLTMAAEKPVLTYDRGRHADGPWPSIICTNI